MSFSPTHFPTRLLETVTVFDENISRIVKILAFDVEDYHQSEKPVTIYEFWTLRT
jgi:hypothetical protein